MALKIAVEDRVSSYPGRIKLSPVSGQTNVYDMERADVPITEGTHINKMLFDNKAYVLAEDATVYVTLTGSDITGTGDADAPYATIQKAVDSIPQTLDGHTATIDIAAGVYEENVVCKGFTGGKLVIGAANKAVILRGIEIDACTNVEVNVPAITSNGKGDALLHVKNGSTVFIPGDIGLDGGENNLAGILATMGSVVYAAKYFIATIDNCNVAAVSATSGSRVVLATVTGSNNFLGLVANMGGVITYETHTLESSLGDAAQTGGMILTGGGSYALADASVE